MGILQRAMETYDAMHSLVGVEEEGKEVLAPIGHIITKVEIVVTLDKDGNFIQARPADEKIIIPVTEESAGRTSGLAAHPLDEQLSYLSGLDADKRTLYLDQLRAWCDSEYAHPKAIAVLKYVEGGKLMADLASAGLLKYDEDGSIKNEKNLVSWIVNGLGEKSGPVWRDTELMQSFADYYIASRAEDAARLCMLSGEEAIPAKQHLKGVFSLNGNAKIISANDKQNFTYRGRFQTDDEASTVGYTASQKAHNALKWVVTNQGVIRGGRAFVCWNPRGITVPRVGNPLVRRSESRLLPSDYREVLRRAVDGWKEQIPESEGVVIAAFDAATTGRLAVTYYSELQAPDFIDRLAYWDETCCWYDTGWGVSAPLLYTIVRFAFGTQRGAEGKVEADDRVLAQHVQRMISCRIDRAAFPQDIMQALVRKAGNLQVYSPSNRRQLLFTACAGIRKYRIDRFKEDIGMALEPQRRDRSYQFGRLLAVMEKIETDTYDHGESRQPNAIRLQSVFVQRPGYATKIVMDQLKNAYYPRLSVGLRIFYDRLIGEIMEQICAFDESEYNKPLTETYLPGYYLQKNALYTAKDKDENDMEVEEDEV